MGKYLHNFKSVSDRQNYIDNAYRKPYCALIDNQVETIEYNLKKGDLYGDKPLTFKILSDGNIIWKAASSEITRTIEYSKNDGAWTSITATTGGTEISVVSGDVVKFRGDNAKYATTSTTFNSFGESTCDIKAYGNIMSLINSTGFTEMTALTSANTWCFAYMLGGEKIVDVEGVYLPAITLSDYCYYNMFKGCTSIVKTPELPATTLASRCYGFMFDGCTSLVNVPELPATTLASYCYYSMFKGCSSLVNAPELPATTLAQQCYYAMLSGCTSLVSAPALPATTLASYCYQEMFRNCSSLVNAPELPATTLIQYCYAEMFMGCRSLVNAPALPATTLAQNCYAEMFTNCSGLVSAPALPATTLTSNCYNRMFKNCTNLSYIKAMFTTTPSSSYTQAWVDGVAATGTFVKNSAAEWNVTGTNGIPSGWTVQTASN